jgi:hypothetical protein
MLIKHLIFMASKKKIPAAPELLPAQNLASSGRGTWSFTSFWPAINIIGKCCDLANPSYKDHGKRQKICISNEI